MVAIFTGPSAFPQTVPTTTDVAADIRGIVSDSANGERLIGVNVIVKGTKRGATTNTSGFYTLTHVPGGLHELVVSAVGYIPRIVTLRITRNEPITLNVRLTPQPIQTGEVLVQSEGISALTERSVSVHVMTPQEIRMLPAVAQSDLLRSIQLLPGITSTSDVSAKFFVRGGASDQNLILLDGMKIHNPFHAFGLFSVLDPDLVRSAEVYTGAFPAGYGGRLSSIVNVTTKEGNLSKVSGNASINFLSGKLELDGPFSGDNSWLVSGRTSLFNKTVNHMIPNAAPVSFYDLFVKGTMGTSTGRLGFRGFLSSDDVNPTASDQPDHSWRSAAASVVLSGVADERLYYDATVNYSYSENRRLPKPGSAITPALSRLEEAGIKVEMTSFTESQNTLFEGFEILFPTIFDSLYSNGVFPKEYRDSRVTWSAWTRYLGSWGNVGFDLGLHADVMLLFEGYAPYQGLQPRLTFSYNFGDSWIAKASYGTFTQDIIQISNEDDLITLFDAWMFLPDDLRPELARHYVLGVEGSPLPGLALTLQAYIKDYSSLTLYNATKIYPSDADYINGDGDSRGLEALIRYASPLVDIYTSYAFSGVTVNAGTLSYAPRYDRRHTIKAVATLHVLDGLDLTLRWDFGSGYPFTQNAGYYGQLSLSDIATNPFPGGTGNPARTLGDKNTARLPAYYRWDAGITYRVAFDNIRGNVGISLINLSDHKNILYYDRATGKTDYMIPFFPTASFSLDF
jgi:outer membrane cobalamin receptor